MTPKEKALKLVDHYLQIIIFSINQNIEVDTIKVAKKCSLKCIEEIIEDRSLRGQINFTYWKEVKKEVLKL